MRLLIFRIRVMHYDCFHFLKTLIILSNSETYTRHWFYIQYFGLKGWNVAGTYEVLFKHFSDEHNNAILNIGQKLGWDKVTNLISYTYSWVFVPQICFRASVKLIHKYRFKHPLKNGNQIVIDIYYLWTWSVPFVKHADNLKSIVKTICFVITFGNGRVLNWDLQFKSQQDFLFWKQTLHFHYIQWCRG